MGRNKVVLYGTTIMDISDSQVTEDTLIEGSSAYGADGEKIEGTNPYKKAETDEEVDVQGDLIEQITTVLQGKTIGASSGASIETGLFTFSSSMYEPGVDEYTLTSSALKATSRTLILVCCTAVSGAVTSIVSIFKKDPSTNAFVRYDGDFSLLRLSHTSGEHRIVNDSTIYLYGGLDYGERPIETMYFIAV